MNNPLNNNARDEREIQINNEIIVGVARILLILLMLSMLLKLLVLKLPAEQSLTELTCLLVAGTYIVIRKKNAGMPIESILGNAHIRRKSNFWVALMLAIPEVYGTYMLFDKNIMYTAIGAVVDIAITFLVLTLADMFWISRFKKKGSQINNNLDKDEDNLD